MVWFHTFHCPCYLILYVTRSILFSCLFCPFNSLVLNNPVFYKSLCSQFCITITQLLCHYGQVASLIALAQNNSNHHYKKKKKITTLLGSSKLRDHSASAQPTTTMQPHSGPANPRLQCQMPKFKATVQGPGHNHSLLPVPLGPKQ